MVHVILATIPTEVKGGIHRTITLAAGSIADKRHVGRSSTHMSSQSRSSGGAWVVRRRCGMAELGQMFEIAGGFGVVKVIGESIDVQVIAVVVCSVHIGHGPTLARHGIITPILAVLVWRRSFPLLGCGVLLLHALDDLIDCVVDLCSRGIRERQLVGHGGLCSVPTVLFAVIGAWSLEKFCVISRGAYDSWTRIAGLVINSSWQLHERVQWHRVGAACGCWASSQTSRRELWFGRRFLQKTYGPGTLEAIYHRQDRTLRETVSLTKKSFSGSSIAGVRCFQSSSRVRDR